MEVTPVGKATLVRPGQPSNAYLPINTKVVLIEISPLQQPGNVFLFTQSYVRILGAADGSVVGIADGNAEGSALSVAVGPADGSVVGIADGEAEGNVLGVAVGAADGSVVGIADGEAEGTALGVAVGAADGCALCDGRGCGDRGSDVNNDK